MSKGSLVQLNTIYNEDCLVIMGRMPNNSIDSVVTDPPYGLSFMGKHWDYDVPRVELWQEVLRVLKPGGHLLSFSGSRTYHRLAVNIEDAGFEIRDQIMWVYGSGFPKSLNIGKAVDKLQGNEKPSTYMPNDKNAVYGKNYGGGVTDNTPADNEWNGWGTALKPSHEPIVVARKPIGEKNIAENVLKWGTGGINIDVCRVAGEDTTTRHNSSSSSYMTGKIGEIQPTQDEYVTGSTLGRFPANFIHDGIQEEWARYFYCAKSSKSERNKGLECFEKGCTHPTVKPVRLMQYLVRLVTPQGGTCLDPFNGSGTTGIACKLEGFNYIGIEREAEYVEISKARIEAWEVEKHLTQEVLL